RKHPRYRVDPTAWRKADDESELPARIIRNLGAHRTRRNGTENESSGEREEHRPTVNCPHVSSRPNGATFRARFNLVLCRSGIEWGVGRRPRTTCSNLRHRREQPLDVLRARQAVVAVLDEREHDIIAREVRGELDGMLPRHVGVLDPLEDAYRTAGFDHAA